MDAIHLAPLFVIGLLGSVHCIGMCGGIVSALSMSSTARRPFPVKVMSVTKNTVAAAPPATVWAFDHLVQVAAYNTGRIASYMVAGALAGGVAGQLGGSFANSATSASVLSGIVSVQVVGYWLANLMLIALGLYLMGVWYGLARLEQVGGSVWRRVQPLMKPLLPMDSLPKALALGALWGWVPCGMVYSVLLTAMLSGSPWSGAAVMLAFGLGTLPALLLVGTLGMRLKAWSNMRGVRLAVGMMVLAFGVLGLIRAERGMPAHWTDVFCIAKAW